MYNCYGVMAAVFVGSVWSMTICIQNIEIEINLTEVVYLVHGICVKCFLSHSFVIRKIETVLDIFKMLFS
jgi:hypothetical protein